MNKNEHTPNHEEIARRAEEIWRERHNPAGCDLEIWLEAERQLATQAQQSDYQAQPTGAAERKIALGREDEATRITEETAAESRVEYNISPQISDTEAVEAALPKKPAPSREKANSKSREVNKPRNGTSKNW